MHVAPLVKLKATGKTVSPTTYRRSATPLRRKPKAEGSNTLVFTDNSLKVIN